MYVIREATGIYKEKREAPRTVKPLTEEK